MLLVSLAPIVNSRVSSWEGRRCHEFSRHGSASGEVSRE